MIIHFMMSLIFFVIKKILVIRSKLYITSRSLNSLSKRPKRSDAPHRRSPSTLSLASILIPYSLVGKLSYPLASLCCFLLLSSPHLSLALPAGPWCRSLSTPTLLLSRGEVGRRRVRAPLRWRS
jgi:hypothetical protein